MDLHQGLNATATKHDGADQYLSLDVAVVGGGIAGLIAAIKLRRAGHRVTVFEQSRFANEVGAAIHLAPNATRILLDIGFDPKRAHCVLNQVSSLQDGSTLEKLTWTPLDHIEKVYRSPWYLIHRVDLHEELKRLAVGREGAGAPIVLRTSSRVVGIDVDLPSLTLANCEIIRPNIVIGADGVHSILVESVAGAQHLAKPTGFSAFRWLARVDTLQADPETKWLFDDPRALMITLTGPEHKRLAIYPCRGRELMNFVAIHPEAAGENAKEDWNISASSDHLLQEYSSFHPGVKALCRHADDLQDLKLWQLLYRSPITPWTKGKVCLVGDAVHPMLPHQGQGGGMALEDGSCLGVLLSDIKSLDEIPARFELFQQIRYERTACTQILSNAGFDEVENIQLEASKYVKTLQIPRNQTEIHKFFFSYDVTKDAAERLKLFKQQAT